MKRSTLAFLAAAGLAIACTSVAVNEEGTRVRTLGAASTEVTGDSIKTESPGFSEQAVGMVADAVRYARDAFLAFLGRTPVEPAE